MNKKINNKLLIYICILLILMIVRLLIPSLERCCILYFLLISTTILLSLTYKKIQEPFKIIILFIPYIYAIYILANKEWKISIKEINIVSIGAIIILTLIICLKIYINRKNYISFAFLSIKFNNLSIKKIIFQIFQLVFLAIFEEICYRAIILDEILKVTEVTKAIFISSFLFVIHHYCSSLYKNCGHKMLFELFIFSIILGSLSIITGGIWIAIYGHILYNFPQIVVYIYILMKEKTK